MEEKESKKNTVDDDILHVVKKFILHFESVDKNMDKNTNKEKDEEL
jgi:hypothetical protein